MSLRNLKDATNIKTKALPDGIASIYTDGIDLGHSANGEWLAGVEFEIEAPILTTTELPDTKTMTYDVEMDTDPLFGSPTTLYAGMLVQTGAGAAGAAAASKRFALPANVERYVRVKASNSGAGDATGKSVTFQALH